MANKSNPTPSVPKSKPRLVDSDKRKRRTPQGVAKLVALGVPKALADTFPLTAHVATKRWCAKLKTPHGWKMFYFGALSDWQAAFDRFQAEKADLIAGRTPETRDKDGLRLRELCNRFLHAKRSKIAAGKMTQRSWYDYHQCATRLVKFFGPDRLVENLEPTDFEALMADFGQTWGPVRIGNEVNRARIIFNYAFKQRLIATPVEFGEFKRTDKVTLRKHRARQKALHGPRMFSAEELHRIIDAAPQPLKAMALLGINGGLNNMDVATLYMGALDLDRGWLDFPRGKTGVPRRIPLWPETVQAVKEWLAMRSEPKHEGDAQLVFLTKQRRAWFRLGRFVDDGKGNAVVKGIDNPVSKSFRVLLDGLGLNGRRNFLALRHTFRTVGRGAKDREAIDALMGHVDESVASHYIEDSLPDERLRAVTEHVRAWLFGPEAK